MSTLSKYIVYECSVCRRETEIALDARRPDPTRCNITLHCRGLLSRVGERSSKGFLFTPLVPGLDDYIPRGQSTVVVPTVTPPSPISVYTGAGVMTAAVFRRDVDPLTRQVTFWIKDVDGSRLTVETPASFDAPTPVNSSMVLSLYEITPELLKFKKFSYNVGAGSQLIRGVDDSPGGMYLRFGASDAVRVVLNGVELSPDKYDRSVDNQITMTPAVTVQNSILEVLVWDEIPSSVPSSDLVELTFLPLSASPDDLALREMSCWGDFFCADFGRIYDADGPRTLMYCTDTSELNVAKTYGISKAEIILANGTRVQINQAEFYVMLGREPFLFQDKELNAFVLGTKFLDSTTSLSFLQSESSGDYEIVVDQSLITQKYNPITPEIPVTSAVQPQTVEVQAAHGTEDLKRKYILGPS